MKFRQFCIIACVVACETGGLPPASPVPRVWAQSSSSPANNAGAAYQIESVETVVKNARSLIRRQQYRAAEKLLLDRLASSSAAGNEMLEAALGEVYFSSRQDEKAVLRLKRSLIRYQRISPSTIQLLREESRVAGLLAETYARQLLAADAISVLQQVYACYKQQAIVDPPTQMDILSRLAALGETKSGSEKSAPPVDQEMNSLQEILQTSYARRLVPADDYFQGMARLAKYQSALRRFDQAAATLERLIKLGKTEHGSFDQLSLRLQLAEVYREAGQIDREIAALQAALPESSDIRSGSASNQPALPPQQLYRVAETQRLLADAWMRKKDRSQAAQQLALALQNYAAALQQANRPTSDDENKGIREVETSPTVLLERLVTMNDERKQLSAHGNLPAEDDLRWHQELLDTYQQSLFPDDAHLARLKLSFAGLYLGRSEFQQARTILQQLRTDCVQRRPTNVTVLAQTLSMLAECDLAIASRESLSEAADVLAQASEATNGLPADDDLRLSVRLNLGRLKAAQAQYRQALAELDQIASAQQASPRLRSLALLYLGLLYKEQLKLDQSLELCRRALEMRRTELAADDPELLRYYLALSELYIARHDDEQHDIQSLAEVIQHAEAACQNLPDDHPNRAAVLHQQAMVHYLNDQHHRSADQRQAARNIWEQLASICQRTGQQATHARALHYLARLDYLDWTQSVKAWNERLRRKFRSARIRGTQGTNRSIQRPSE